MKHEILITGSEGFVGKNLTRLLASKGHQITRLSRSLGHDITRSESFPTTLAIGTVIHLAALTDPKANSNLLFQTNVLGTQEVLDFCSERKVPLIFFSTYLYGPQNTENPIPEDAPLSPHNNYASTKLEAEKRCFLSDVPVVVFRPFNIYGPEQQLPAIVPSIIDAIKKDQSFEVFEPPVKRDLLFIDDLARAVELLLDKPLKEKAVYNLGSGEAVTTQDIIKELETVTGRRLRVTVIEDYSNIRSARADISRAKKDLGWKPRVTLSQGLTATVEASRFASRRAENSQRTEH